MGTRLGFPRRTRTWCSRTEQENSLKKIFLREDKEEQDNNNNNNENDSTSNPDVICVQECDHYYDFFEPEMQKRGYFGIYREDKWSPCQKFSNELKDGLAIFCKRETVELVGMHVSTTRRRRRSKMPKCCSARLIMKKSLTRQEVR